MMSVILITFAAAIPVLRAGPLLVGGWARHGFRAKDRERLERFLDDAVKEGRTAGGSLLLLHRGEVILQKPFGYANIRKRIPFRMTTPCIIASISKPILATLAVKLASEGTLKLDAPIDSYLPEFKGIRLRSGDPARRAPTVRELLKHTAGFTPDKGKGGRPWFWRERPGKTLEEMVKLYPLFPIPGLYDNPGEKFRYSGMGYDIAGRIIEVVTGRPLNAVLKEKLCDPLEMNETTYLPEKEMQARAARRYYLWRSDGTLHVARRKHFPPTSSTTSSQYVSVGGGIYSTPDDLARFLLMHRNRGAVGGRPYLPEKGLLDMYKREKPRLGYGIGFVLGPASAINRGRPEWILHSGSSGTLFWLDFDHDVIGVLLTQTQRSDGRASPGIKPKIDPGAPKLLRRAKRFIDEILSAANVDAH